VNINRVVLAGNLTQDVETKEGKDSGKKFCRLRVACNSRRKVGESWEEVPGFYDVTVFGAQAKAAAEHLSKGSLVAVDGRLEWREWEQDGKTRQAVSVVAESLQFGPRTAQAGSGDAPQEPQAETAATDSGGAEDW